MSVPRWQIYEKRQQNKRERWYCDVGPTSEEWNAMSDQQRGVFKRWQRYYRRRRALREMCSGRAI